jgi:hypothetical protein
MSNLTKSMEAGDRDTVVEKLLAIFPAMDREVARYSSSSSSSSSSSLSRFCSRFVLFRG